MRDLGECATALRVLSDMSEYCVQRSRSDKVRALGNLSTRVRQRHVSSSFNPLVQKRSNFRTVRRHLEFVAIPRLGIVLAGKNGMKRHALAHAGPQYTCTTSCQKHPVTPNSSPWSAVEHILQPFRADGSQLSASAAGTESTMTSAPGRRTDSGLWSCGLCGGVEQFNLSFTDRGQLGDCYRKSQRLAERDNEQLSASDNSVSESEIQRRSTSICFGPPELFPRPVHVYRAICLCDENMTYDVSLRQLESSAVKSRPVG